MVESSLGEGNSQISNDQERSVVHEPYAEHTMSTELIKMEQLDHKRTYKEQADIYERLVSREDYQENILPAIQKIIPLAGKCIADLGAGTGRLANILTREAGFVITFDISFDMSRIAHEKSLRLGLSNVGIGIADHRELPLASENLDLVISGWSICYLVDWYPEAWKMELVRGFREMHRVLKKNGMIILLETMGTGFGSPHPPSHLDKYFNFLTKIGFSKKWIRTDYQFKDMDEATELAGFFFGSDLVDQINKNQWVILEECTGIWWCAVNDIKLPKKVD